MHVALLSPAWPPETTSNGIVTYVHWMRLELLARGHRVSVFSGTVNAGLAKQGIHRIETHVASRLLHWLRFRVTGRWISVFEAGAVIASAIKRVHHRDPIDVIEMEESFGWFAEVARCTGLPIVVKLHGPAFLHLVEEDLHTAAGQEKVRREGEALARSPVIIAPSRSTLQDTLSRYRLEPRISQQVVNPISLPADAPVWDSDRCDPESVLFVGRFDKVKGGDLAIRVLQRLLRRRPDVRLEFVGPDEGLVTPDGNRQSLDEFVTSLGDSRVRAALSYRGRLSKTEIADLRVRASVTIVTSRHENQAYTVLEAMLQGCPVVCFDNSGTRESIENEVTGLLASDDDVEGFAAQVERVLDRSEFRRALGSEARRYVLRDHAPAAVAEQMLDVYRRTIALHPAGEIPAHVQGAAT